MITKYGFDGSGSHALYSMAASEIDIATEAQLFATFICPIMIKVKGTDSVVWHNPAPSSLVYCRPLHMQCIKETPEVTRDEYSSINTEIYSLQPTRKDGIKVCHTLIPTMVDGKVSQALSHTASSSSCYLCSPVTKPSQMNNLHAIKEKRVAVDFLKHSISPLHLYINTMECVLHLAYRIQLKTWCVKGKAAQAVMTLEKKRVQKEVKRELHINVDFPCQGSGNTNNGNTARFFFKEWAKISEITGVDEELIRRFGVLLTTLNSRYAIDAHAYELYAEASANVNKYNWYYMPVSVAKMLMHGAHVIDMLFIPVGQASEEAIEARHKDIRRVRLDHTCKTSRSRVNQDLMHWLLASSDPMVAFYRKRGLKKASEFPKDVISLLKEPNYIGLNSDVENDDDNND